MESVNCSSSDQCGNGNHLHVVMMPWLAHGHISPFIQLSKRLLDRQNLKISFVSTPLNIAKIKLSFPEKQGNLNLLELPLPRVEGLPPGIENTSYLPNHFIFLFHEAARGLEKPLQTLLDQISPDIVIFDYILYWISKVALRLKIPSVVFTTYGAAYMGYCFSPARRSQGKEITAGDVLRPPPDFPSTAVRYRPFELASVMPIYTYTTPRGEKHIDTFVDCFYDCAAIAIKSCYELEGNFIEYFRQVTGSLVVPVGALLPRPYPVKQNTPGESEHECLKWLEGQSPASVVYVSFGTEYFLSKMQIEEIAQGLEASLQPFLWILRFPNNSDEDRDEVQTRVSASLPEGFESRVAARGMVLSWWAPQQKILCHPSTGAFVTHCGWNSLMEGMGAGLPLIALPMQLDQGLNAQLIVHELHAGVEVERGSDGSVSRGDVCRAVRMIMVEEEGKKLKSKAAEMRDLFKTKILDDEGSQGCGNQYVDDLLKLLRSLKVH